MEHEKILECGWEIAQHYDIICHQIPDKSKRKYKLHKFQLYVYEDFTKNGDIIEIWYFKALRGYGNEGWQNRRFVGKIDNVEDLKRVMRQIGMDHLMNNRNL